MTPHQKKLKKARQDHKLAQIAHAIKRAKERYDITLDENDIIQIGKIVANNKHIREDFVNLSIPNRRVQIQYKDQIMWVVYCMQTNCVATFLPKEHTRLTFSTTDNK